MTKYLEAKSLSESVLTSPSTAALASQGGAGL
jgi:hypothetical protein